MSKESEMWCFYISFRVGNDEFAYSVAAKTPEEALRLGTENAVKSAIKGAVIKFLTMRVGDLLVGI